MPPSSPPDPSLGGGAPAHPSRRSGALDTAPLRTYLVEDSSVIRDNLIALLAETVPLNLVGNAEDEATASGWLRDHPGGCDLVIVDIFLKHGSGLGVLSLRRELPDEVQLVVLSNHATVEMRSKCLEMGADAVFDKSNEIEALLLFCKRLAGLDVIADDKNSLATA